MNKKYRNAGAIVEIVLPKGMLAYGQILDDPLVGFWSTCYRERQLPEALAIREFDLRLWVHNDAFRSGRWKEIGTASIPENSNDVLFFKQDAISKRISLYEPTSGRERSLAIDDLPKYEAAAIWDPEHVEQRLQDICEGKENIFASDMTQRAIAEWMKKFSTSD